MSSLINRENGAAALWYSERKGWTHYERQKKSGITYPTLRHSHQKSKLYSGDLLNRLSVAFGYRPGDLLRWNSGK